MGTRSEGGKSPLEAPKTEDDENKSTKENQGVSKRIEVGDSSTCSIYQSTGMSKEAERAIWNGQGKLFPHTDPPTETGFQLTEKDDNRKVDPADLTNSSVSAVTLPEEIWLKVFEMLDSSADLESCFRTCENWNKWIMGKRDWLPTVLFPKVAPLLLEKLYKLDLLNCRKVCRVWKEGIDNAYQTHPQLLRLHFEISVIEPRLRLPNLVNGFSCSGRVLRFLKEMGFHRGNPFVGRAIRLYWNISHPFFTDERDLGYEDSHFRIEYWSHVIKLLDLFGSQVHFATIELHFYDGLEDAKEIVVHLRNCLLRLPHLRRLNIAGLNGSVATKYRKELQDYILAITKANPMPLLVDLETLEMNLQTDLANKILNFCCVPAKIKRLKLKDDWELSDTLYQFPNQEVVIKSTLQLENLKWVSQKSIVPPLRELDLNFGSADYARVFKCLELFSDTLTIAKVSGFCRLGNGCSCYPLQQLTAGINARINLPKLKRLVLVDYDGPLDLFLGLNSLEHLDLEIDFKGLVIHLGGAAQFYAVFERIFSKFWTLMLSLKMIAVGRGSFKPKYDRKTFANNPARRSGRETT